MMKLQSLSAPSQTSGPGVPALHVDQPVVALHVCVPRHVPLELETEQLRIAPSMAALHEQLPVTGWQKFPLWPPLASGAHVYPVGHALVHGVPQNPPPSSGKHAPPPHSVSLAHAKHSCGADGTQTFTSASGSLTDRHSQPAGQSSLHVREHTPPLAPSASTQYPDRQSVCFVHAESNSPGCAGASGSSITSPSMGARDGAPQLIAHAHAIATAHASRAPTTATLGCLAHDLQYLTARLK
jgi:hypothetical protein